MYNYASALAIKYGNNAKYEEIDLTGIPNSSLFTIYKKIYVRLTHPNIIGPLTLDLHSLPSNKLDNNDDFLMFLTNNGNNALPIKRGSPTVITKNALFVDAHIAGYHVDSIDYNVGEGVILSDEEKPHLVLKDELFRDINYVNMRARVLANVNGFYHYTAANDKGFYIVDGNKTKRKSQQNKVGLLSTNNLARFWYIRINNNMLSLKKDGNGNVVSVSIKYSSVKDHESRFKMLILGGYMLLVDNQNLFYTGDNILTLKLHKYPLLERYFESYDFLDFSKFDVNHLDDNRYHVNRLDLYKEKFIKGYFTMSNSFIVSIDSKDIMHERIYVEKDKIPHTYLSWSDPKYPLVTCEGKHSVYWKQEDDGCWLMRCTDTYKGNMTMHTTSINDIVGVDDAWWMGNAGDYSPAYMLKLYKEEVKIMN